MSPPLHYMPQAQKGKDNYIQPKEEGGTGLSKMHKKVSCETLNQKMGKVYNKTNRC